MKTIFRLAVLSLLLGGWGLAAASLHAVRVQNDRVLLIPKERLGFHDTYVDARAWTLADVGQHPLVVQRIIESGKADEMKYACGTGCNENIVDALNDAVKNAPIAAATTNAPAVNAQAAMKGLKADAAAASQKVGHALGI